jgi:hypothetical protein
MDEKEALYLFKNDLPYDPLPDNASSAKFEL